MSSVVGQPYSPLCSQSDVLSTQEGIYRWHKLSIPDQTWPNPRECSSLKTALENNPPRRCHQKVEVSDTDRPFEAEGGHACSGFIQKFLATIYRHDASPAHDARTASQTSCSMHRQANGCAGHFNGRYEDPPPVSRLGSFTSTRVTAAGQKGPYWIGVWVSCLQVAEQAATWPQNQCQEVHCITASGRSHPMWHLGLVRTRAPGIRRQHYQRYPQQAGVIQQEVQRHSKPANPPLPSWHREAQHGRLLRKPSAKQRERKLIVQTVTITTTI